MDRFVETSARLFVRAEPQRTVQTAAIVERRLEILVGDAPFASLAALAERPAETAVGHLYAEGFSPEALRAARVRVKDSGETVRVFVDLPPSALPRRSAQPLVGTGGGTSGEAVNLQDKPRPSAFHAPETVMDLFAALDSGSELYRRTRGCHAGLLAQNNTVLLRVDDVGRHNCLDALIGYALLHQIPLDQTLVVMTGRAAFEVVRKAVQAQVGALCMTGTPTSRGLALACAAHMPLIGRGSPHGFTLFAG